MRRLLFPVSMRQVQSRGRDRAALQSLQNRELQLADQDHLWITYPSKEGNVTFMCEQRQLCGIWLFNIALQKEISNSNNLGRHVCSTLRSAWRGHQRSQWIQRTAASFCTCIALMGLQDSFLWFQLWNLADLLDQSPLFQLAWIYFPFFFLASFNQKGAEEEKRS